MDRRERWKDLFIQAFRESGIISQALMYAGISRTVLRAGLEKDKDFLEEFHDAKADAIDSLETEAVRRAKDGSDQLLMFLLKSHRPEVYRENHKIEVTGHFEVDHKNALMDKLAAMAELVQPKQGVSLGTGPVGALDDGGKKNEQGGPAWGSEPPGISELKSGAEDIAFVEVEQRRGGSA
jgi:hypothetical protein